jgi:hypothetical protein
MPGGAHDLLGRHVPVAGEFCRPRDPEQEEVEDEHANRLTIAPRTRRMMTAAPVANRL